MLKIPYQSTFPEVSEQAALVGSQRQLLQTILPPLPDLMVDMNQEFTYQIPDDTFGVRPEAVSLNITLSEGTPLPEWLSVSGPSLEPKLHSVWETGNGYTYRLALYEDYLYLADGIPGMRVINVQDKANPQLVRTIQNGDGHSIAYDVAIYQNYVFLADETGGMQVFDISNPASPSQINHVSFNNLREIRIHGNYVFAIDYHTGLYVFDISQIANIRQTAHISLGQNYPGPSGGSDIDIDENYLYLLSYVNREIQFFDVSNTNNPVHASTLSVEKMSGLEAQYPYLYVAAANEFLVYDITDVQEPLIIKNYTFDNQQYSSLVDVSVNNDLAYLTTSTSLLLADISSPETLRILDIVDLDATTATWRTVVHEGYVYTTAGTNGLKITDLGLHWRIEGTPTVEDVGEWPLVLFANTTEASQEQTTLTITVEAAPIIIQPTPVQFAQPSDFFYFNISNQTFYHPTDMLWPKSILQESGEPLPSWLSTGFEPAIWSTVPTSHAFDIQIQGNYAYIADIEDGLIIMDIEDRKNPYIVSSYPVTPAWSLAVQGNYAYVAAELRRLEIFDISNASSPQYIARADVPDKTYGVAVRGNYAYVANFNYGLQIVNIANPYSPYIVSSLDTPGLNYRVALHGNYAYLGDGALGKAFRIVDISNVASPRLVASVGTPSYAWTMTFSGNYGFFADQYYGFHIVDVSSPSSPQVLASVSTPSFCNRVLVTGDYAIAVSSHAYSSAIYDISDPNAPQLLLTTAAAFIGLGAEIQGQHLFLAGSSYGLQILDISLERWFVRGTPTKDNHGVYEIAVTVGDVSGKTVTDTFSLSVNHLPQLTEPLQNKTVNVGDTFNEQISSELYLDFDGDPLTYSANVEGSTWPNWLTFNPLIRKFTGIPDYTDAAELPISIHVDDGYLGTPHAVWWLTVNTPPEFIATEPETHILVQTGEAFSRLLGDWFYDADGHALRYQVTHVGGLPLAAWMSYTQTNTTLWGNPGSLDSGVHHLQIQADDAKGGEITAYMSVRVNSKPILNHEITGYTAYVGEPFNLQFPYTTFVDPDEGDRLVYSAQQINDTGNVSLSGWLSFDIDSQKFTGMPTSADKGQLNIALAVSDGYGGEASVVFPINVPNRSPEIQSVILPPSAQIWQYYEYPINPAVVLDRDGDTLIPTVTSHDGTRLPDWLYFDADKWLLYGRPGVIPWQGADVNLRFQVGDGEDTAETEFAVPVGIDHMIALIGSIYAATGVFFLASNLITKWTRAALLRKAGHNLAAAAGRAAPTESSFPLLQTSYRNMSQALGDKADNMLDMTRQYTEQMKQYFLTTAQAGHFDQVHPWHAISDSIAEIKQRIVTSAAARNQGYERYLPVDVDWCASLALLLQGALLVQHHLGRKASYDERKVCQKELDTIADAIEGHTGNAIEVKFHLACAQAALVCMEDSYHWLSLGFLGHLAAVTFSPPNGALSLSASSKDIPQGWYPRLVLVQQLAQAAQRSDSAAFSQLLALQGASGDWRFVYGYTLAMQGIVRHCSDAGIRTQAQGQLQTLQRFSQFRLQKFNGCCFFKHCCQNRNQWIRRQAGAEVAAYEHAEMNLSPATPLYSETGDRSAAGFSSSSPLPPPRPPPSHLRPGHGVQMSSYTPR